MGARGPKSAGELTVATSAEVVPINRPRAPACLNDEQASEWREIVNSLPAEDVPRMRHAELANYCRHTITQRRLDHLIAQVEEADEFDLDKWNKLLAMRERETRAAASLSVRLGFAFSTSSESKKPKTQKKSLRADW